MTKYYDHTCKCGCGLMPDKEFVRKLYLFRLLVNERVSMSSVARCKAHNKAEGGVKNSAHLKGAGDAKWTIRKKFKWVKAAQTAGFNGIGISKKFIHLDDKHTPPKIWTY